MSGPSAGGGIPRASLGLRSERGPVLLAVMVATGLVAIDANILATAVPSVVADLGGFSSFPWLFSIYLLATAVTVPVYSKLADVFGRKPIMLLGIALFLTGSVLCGFAWDMPSLIVFRAVQGLGAGAIQPLTLTIMGDTYTVAERAKVQGYVGAVWGVASVVGPTLGGVFSQLDAWRWIFFVNVPLCLLAAGLIWRKYHEHRERREHRIDVAGSILVTFAAALLILGALEGGNAWEWGSPWSIGVFALGGALAIAFVLVERRAAEPVVPFKHFRMRMFSSTVVVNFALGAGLTGLTAYVPTYLEVSAGAIPIVAGLGLATFTIGWPLAAAQSGRIYLTKGFRFTVVLGSTIVLAGAVALSVLVQWPAVWTVAIACFVIGAGLGLTAMPGLIASQSMVPWHERGAVTGTVMFSRSIGQAFGAAILGAVANAVISAHGGNEQDPAAMTAATSAITIGVVIISVLILASALAMPRHRSVEEERVEEIAAEEESTGSVAEA